MSGTKEARTARYRNAIVTAAIAAVLLCGGRASAWAASAGTPAPPATQASAATFPGSDRGATPAAATSSPIADQYAERETSARNLEQFKGGDVVIIGSTGVIVVLLLIIILLSL